MYNSEFQNKTLKTLFLLSLIKRTMSKFVILPVEQRLKNVDACDAVNTYNATEIMCRRLKNCV